MNRLLKILVVFIIAIISVIIIYYTNITTSKTPLLITDDKIITEENYDIYINNPDIITIKNNQLTYKELYRMIYYDEKVYYKGKYQNIKYVIRNSSEIIISINNINIYQKCDKNTRIQKEYLKNSLYEITKITNLIKQISTSKIYIQSPYCENYNKELKEYIEKNYKNDTNLYFITIKNKEKQPKIS